MVGKLVFTNSKIYTITEDLGNGWYSWSDNDGGSGQILLDEETLSKDDVIVL